MAIEKVINVTVQGNADEAVGSLRSQLRLAQAEVATLSDKFGVASKEAVAAAKAAAILKDKIGDAKSLTDAFNPDAKFKSLSGALAGVAGGFAAVQGGMALLGVQSESVEKTLLKVQSAMALSAGLQQIGDSVDKFKELGAVVKSYSIVQKVITAGQWLWNAAMAANPIGAIVIAITALIAGGYALVKMFMDSAEAEETAMAATKQHTKDLENQAKEAKKSSDKLKDHNGHLYDMAKAAGASSEELRKLALKHAEEDVVLAKNNTTIAANTFNRERNTLATLKAAGASDEVIAAQQKLTNESYKEFQEQDKILVESYKNRKEIVQKNEVEISQEKTDATKKSIDDAKAKADVNNKLSEEEKEKKLKDLKEFNDSVLQGQHDLQLATNEAQFNQRTLDQENQDEKLRLLNEGVEEVTKAEESETNIKQLNADAQKKIDDEKQKARQQQLANISVALQQASELAGKSTAAGKALAIASTVISTYQTAQSAYQSAFLPVPTVASPALGAVYAGIAVAGGLANISKIMSVKVPGGGGGGGGAPSISGAVPSASAAPQFNVVGNSGVNQLAGVLSTKEQTPIKAYVVPSDVTSGQSLDRNVISGASIG